MLLAANSPPTNTTISTVIDHKKPRYICRTLQFLQNCWTKLLQLNSDLLVVLLPLTLRTLQFLHVVVPSITERLTQYTNPSLSLLTAVLLARSQRGMVALQRILGVSVALGGLCMWRDSHLAGGRWGPLNPQSDAYAVVTG